MGGESASSVIDTNAPSVAGKLSEKETMNVDAASKDYNSETGKKNELSERSSCFLLALAPCGYICNCSGSKDESSEQQISEDGMFYCSLCEVEVYEIFPNGLSLCLQKVTNPHMMV